MKTPYDVILKPVISEKSMDAAQAKKYTFKVAVDANKTEVKNAVEEIFGKVVVAHPEKLRSEIQTRSYMGKVSQTEHIAVMRYAQTVFIIIFALIRADIMNTVSSKFSFALFGIDPALQTVTDTAVAVPVGIKAYTRIGSGGEVEFS